MGMLGQLGGDEALPRDAPHGVQHARIADAARFELPAHHVFTLALEGHAARPPRYDHEPTSGRSASKDA